MLYMLVTIKIEKKDYDALKAVAKKNGQYLSFLLSQAVEQYLENKQKAQAA